MPMVHQDVNPTPENPLATGGRPEQKPVGGFPAQQPETPAPYYHHTNPTDGTNLGGPLLSEILQSYQTETPNSVPYNPGNQPAGTPKESNSGSGSGGSGGGSGGGYGGGGAAAPTGQNLNGAYNYHSNIQDVYESVPGVYQQMNDTNQQYNSLIDWNNMAVDAATQNQITQLETGLNNQIAQLNMLKARYAQLAETATDNELLRQRALGNYGGVGESQITHARADYDNKIVQLDLQQVQAMNDLNAAIAQANATGDITKAQYAIEIASTILGNQIQFLQNELSMNAQLAGSLDNWNLSIENLGLDKIQSKISQGVPVSAADFLVYGYTGADAEAAAQAVNDRQALQDELQRLNLQRAMYSGSGGGSSSGSSGTQDVGTYVNYLLQNYGSGLSYDEAYANLIMLGVKKEVAEVIAANYANYAEQTNAPSPISSAIAGAAIGGTLPATGVTPGGTGRQSLTGAPSSGINFGG